MKKLIVFGCLGILLIVFLMGQVPDTSSFSYIKSVPDLTKFLYIKSLSDFLFSVATNTIPGYLHEHKFGRNPEIDSGDTEDVWDQGGTYTFLSTATTLYLSSSNDSDTQDIQVYGLDADWALQTITEALTGRTQVEIGTGITWLRVFRAKNVDSTDVAGDVYIAEDAGVDITAGVPDTASEIKAKITNPFNQTLMAIYTIPTGYTGYMMVLHTSMNRAQATGAVDMQFYVKPFGQVFQLKDFAGLMSSGTSHTPHIFTIPEEIEAKSDIKITATSSANDVDVSAGFDIILVPN